MKKALIAIACASVFLVGCNDETPAKNKVTQAQKAKKAAESVRFTENAEIDNIKNRLELTSQPSLLGYVSLVNKLGQVVMYTPVKGKITSGGKRLTKPVKTHSIDRGQYRGTALGPAPSDEGTWGSSNPYVYFWTPTGRYIQTSMDYVYSDQPFRLTEKPLIDFNDVSITKAEKKPLAKPTSTAK